MFRSRSRWKIIGVSEGRIRTVSMLTILLATCETTLHTLQAADNPLDGELTGLLTEMIERTRLEIDRLNAGV
jgi:hypothetical protein